MKKIFFKKYWAVFLLTLIVLLGGFLRFYELGKQSFRADEFLDINAAYGYFKTEQWHAWDFNLGAPAKDFSQVSDERAWIYRWQVAQLFRVLPPTEAVARSVSAVWGILTIVLIYLVGRYFLSNKIIGLVGAFLFAVSFSGIILDMRLRMYAMFFPVFLIFSLALFYFLESKYSGKNKFIKKINDKLDVNFIWALPVLLLGLLSYHLHQLTVNIIPIVIIYAIIQSIISFANKKNFYNKYNLILAGFLFSVLILKFFFLEKAGPLLAGIKIFQDNYSYFAKVTVDYQYGALAAVLLFLGVFFLCQESKKRKEGIWISVSFLTLLIMAVFFWRRNAGEQYIFFAQSFEIILISGGIYYLAKIISDSFSKNKKAVIFSVAMIIMLAIVPNYAELLAMRTSDEYKNDDYRKAFGYFKENRNPREILITRNFRNYYFSKEKVTVLTFGGESPERSKRNLTKEKVVREMPTDGCAWMVWSDGDDKFIERETRDLIADNFETVFEKKVGGVVTVKKFCVKKSGDELKFGFVTDLHSYSKNLRNEKDGVVGREVSRNFTPNLNYFIFKMNEEFRPDFVIENGDFIEGGEESEIDFKATLNFFDKIIAPKYHVLGNHELTNMNKNEWLGLVGYGRTYYYFDKEDYRMIVLDGNFMPNYSGETSIHKDLNYYPGYVSAEQIRWLTDLLSKSEDKKTFVFIHQPPIQNSEFKDSSYFVTNGGVLRSLFEKYKVQAVFSGHIEEICNQEINGVKYFVLPGFYKGNILKNENEQIVASFSEITLNDDDIDVEVFYKNFTDEEKYKAISLTDEVSGCGLPKK